jgi:RNA polymerase sigma-70 factor (ECF subfamily)
MQVMDPTGASVGSQDSLRWLEEHGDALYAYALPRVRNPDVAEDLVQDTLLAALTSAGSFEGRSAYRTWLLGILKHKLVDHLRKTIRQRPVTDLTDDFRDAFFTKDGHWKEAAPSWDAEPDALLERQEFRDALSECMSKMPGRMAQLFWLREAEDVKTETICKELEITPTNAWTLLHRARLSLRRCLNENWFKAGDR